MLLHAGPEICRGINQGLYSTNCSPLPFLAKAVGEANGNAKAQAFDLVHELSIVAQSIESTLSEKENIEAKVRELLEQLVTPFILGVVKITT